MPVCRLESLLRQEIQPWASWSTPLFLSPPPPAWAEYCYRDSHGIHYKGISGEKIYSKAECTILDMKDNDLKELSPEIFNGLNNLRNLYLDQNKLTNLPEGIFNELHNVRTLALDNNKLSSNLWRQSPNIFNNLPS